MTSASNETLAASEAYESISFITDENKDLLE